MQSIEVKVQQLAQDRAISTEQFVQQVVAAVIVPSSSGLVFLLDIMDSCLPDLKGQFPDVKFDSEPALPSEHARDMVSCIKADILGVTDLSQWAREYVENHQMRIAHDVDLIQGIAHGAAGNTVDIGAAPYLLTGSLQRLGFNVVSLDLEPERHQSIIQRLGVSVRKTDIESEALPFPDRSVDLIIFNELFEHLRINLIKSMREVHRIMTTGGYLTLSTPNLRSIVGLVNFIASDRAYSCCSDPFKEFKKLQDIGHMGHIREYTLTEVAGFMKNVGFILRKVTFRGRIQGIDAHLERHPHWRPFMSLLFQRED